METERNNDVFFSFFFIVVTSIQSLLEQLTSSLKGIQVKKEDLIHFLLSLIPP
jgi:hypothetical protein